MDLLLQIERLTPTDKAAWDDNELVRLAIERLWITAGNLAEAYRIAADLPTGIEPWAELSRLRSILAHALPDDFSSNRMWHETLVDPPRLIAHVSCHSSLAIAVAPWRLIHQRCAAGSWEVQPTTTGADRPQQSPLS